ncbi:MAG TPA: hypothetical protein VLA72_19010 [Anaerolineales bacterium]|nr:hypothetical protein [Anaerolineales bacterium]
MTNSEETRTVQSSEIPYPPSWIDRLIHWIDRLPIPVWLFYVLGMLFQIFIVSLALWIDGSVPFGMIGSIPGIFPPSVFAFLALYHYLTRIGSRSLLTFRPLLNVNETEFTRINYEFATLHRKWDWLIIPVSVFMAYPYLIDNPVTWGDLIPNTSLLLVTAWVIISFFDITFFALIIRVIRQLRMIRNLHAQATNINLLKLKPAHAFSILTSRMAIGYILIVIMSYFRDPSYYVDSWNLYGLILMVLVAVVVFIAPVIGLRELLENEKERKLDEASDLLQATTESLHKKLQNNNYDDIGGMETAISTLTRERENLEKISTWPWDTSTLRGFASSLLLPIFLWLITRLLENFF